MAATKVVLITGATDGLGKAVARRFVSTPTHIIVHGRSERRCLDTIEELYAEGCVGVRIEYCVADFRRLQEVFDMIKVIRMRHGHLDLLINNAGLGIESERCLTINGYEAVLQVNYLATYVLSIGLLDLLGERGGQIICISSLDQITLDFDDPNIEHNWTGIVAYARSKWAQATFSCGVASRMARRGVAIHALHPGSLMPTKLVLGKFPVMETIEEGIESVWSLANHEKPMDISGTFIDHQTIAPALDSAYDSAIQHRLLAMSAAMVSSVPGSDVVSWRDDLM